MEPTKSHEVRSRSRSRRLRRLLASEKKTQPKEPSKYAKCFKWAIVLTIIGCLSYAVITQNGKVMEDLSNLSIDQYQLYLYGRPNYCSEQFDYRNISKKFDERLIGQNDAVDEIKLSLRQHTNVTAIALFGPRGTGKSLAMNLVQQNFQWHLNAQQYFWSPIQSQQSQLKSLLKLMAHLTTCGHNAIFIDDIPVANAKIINEFHQHLERECSKNHIKAIAFYAFQPPKSVDEKTNTLIHRIKSIYFREFNVDDLYECILLESKRLGLTLTPRQVQETIRNINVDHSGCKTVVAKIGLLNQND